MLTRDKTALKNSCDGELGVSAALKDCAEVQSGDSAIFSNLQPISAICLGTASLLSFFFPSSSPF